jgi:hypothetical protein
MHRTRTIIIAVCYKLSFHITYIFFLCLQEDLKSVINLTRCIFLKTVSDTVKQSVLDKALSQVGIFLLKWVHHRILTVYATFWEPF